jgi:L-cysteate sulfo-lyase
MTPLDRFDRTPLGFLPTPLEPLQRLFESSNGPRLWIKRDDCTGLATGGNKTRKLEYLMADARAKGADTVITFGAVQSNHARQTAAACAKLGYECHLILARRVKWSHPEFERGGNVLLDELLGAQIRLCEPDQAEATARNLIEALERGGRHCYVIPSGGSNAVGALGYVRCAHELAQQCTERGFVPDLIVHATSSGGTQAGLIAGFASLGTTIPVLGINVYDRDHARITRNVSQLLRDTTTRIGVAELPQASVGIEHRFLGDDYGLPTPLTVKAIGLMAEREGILLDPVYSGKAFGALTALLEANALSHCQNVVFVHTGGSASLPVYIGALKPDRR